jgi:uncharacterized membrane protein YqjE
MKTFVTLTMHTLIVLTFILITSKYDLPREYSGAVIALITLNFINGLWFMYRSKKDKEQSL